MKATNDGTCQLCGRVQRLPGGVMAKHGYTVEWGFFSGECPGSGCTPFEVSCHLIEGAIAGQLVAIEAAKATAADLRNPESPTNDGTKAWVKQYVGSNRQGGIYKWSFLPLTHVVTTYSEGTAEEFQCHKFTVPTPAGSRKPSEDVAQYDYSLKTAKAVAVKLNGDYARNVVEHGIAKRTEYVAWLRKRVANWAPAPLLPRKG